MNFLGKLLKQFFNKRIKMLGRAGIIYRDESDTYFLDSEHLVGSPDVVVFMDNIRIADERKKDVIISYEKKKTIAQQVKAELEAMEMSVQLS
jgi:hypothetical protein